MDPNEMEPITTDEGVEPTPTTPLVSPGGRRKSRRRGAIMGSLLVAGGAGAALLGPLSARAETPSPSAVTTSVGTLAGSGTPTLTTITAPAAARVPMHGGGGLAADDLTAAAAAIGITEAELSTALASGQTLAAIATAHNVTAQKVIDALVKAETDELAAQVTAGTITQAQADANKADLVTRFTDQVNNGVQFGGGGPGGPGGPGHGVDLTVAATTIGISEADLRTALQAGQTLAAIATAHNVTAQAVIDALVKAETDRLAAAVTAGTITQAQADAKKADLVTRITTQVNSTFRFGGWGGNHELVSDTSVAATAIGITEADLITALKAGQSLADVAKAHNVDVQKVIDALVKDELDELAADVTAGRITQAQADARKPDITTRITARVNGTFQFGGGGPGGPGHGVDLTVVATTIGISEADLRTALQAGQTLAAVATAHNVTAQAVIDALVKAETDRLAAAVTAGTITQAQADAKKADLVTRITTQVNSTFQFGGRGGHGGRGGPGGVPGEGQTQGG